jgi:hypothetical protein
MSTSDQALNAAQAIVSKYGIGGSADCGYISNVIIAEVERFDSDPFAQIIQRRWVGECVTTGMTMEELRHFAGKYGARRVAQAAAISLVRAYPTSIEKSGSSLKQALVDLAKLIDLELFPYSPPENKSVKKALAKINRNRARIGERPLDPKASGWTDKDVLLEARRLQVNPWEAAKARLLAW